MNVFKTFVGSLDVHNITQENFDEATKRQPPWFQPIK